MTPESQKDAVSTAGLKVLERFMTALNAYDAAAMDTCMHFPHVRMAESNVAVYRAPGSNPMDLFDRLKAVDNWHHSAWDVQELIQWNEAKAHWRLTYTRYRDDGSIIGRYDSLYILTSQSNVWGIQARSSFGP